MFWLGLALPLVYIPAWTGYMILSGWVLLSVVLPFLLLQRIRIGWAHWLGLAFLTYTIASLAWAPIPVQGVWDLWLLWILAFSFCVGAIYNLSDLYRGAAFGMGINLILAIAQWFGWHPLLQVNPDVPSALFVNPNVLGETAAIVSIGLAITRQYWSLALTLPCVWISDSRAGLLGLFVASVVWLWNKLRWQSIYVMVPLALIIGGFGWLHKPDKLSIEERSAIWLDTIGGLTPFGHGAGSFFMLYPEYAKRTDTMATRPEQAHNDFLELIFEFGLGTIPLFCLVGVGFLIRSPYRPFWAAFCAIALVSFPKSIPIEGFLGLSALGALCRDRNLAWSKWSDRGSTLWARLCSRGREALSLESLYPNSSRLQSDRGSWTD